MNYQAVYFSVSLLIGVVSFAAVLYFLKKEAFGRAVFLFLVSSSCFGSAYNLIPDKPPIVSTKPAVTPNTTQ
jgi:hypothetical protein